MRAVRQSPPRCAPFWLLLATLLLSPAASAQEDAALEPYRQHMKVGVDLYTQKNYVAAISEFEEAYKAKPKASPLVNIALCHKAMFAYPKAVSALSAALEKHSDTMSDDEKKAAQKEIEEMRALLAYVTFDVTPSSQFVVWIDGEAHPEAAQGKEVAISPGPRTVRVSAEGYAAVEEQVKLASGARALKYKLLPNMGFVRIKAQGAKYAIAVDQKALDYGQWSGLLSPGPHVIEMYIPGSPTAPYRVRLDVEVGKSYEIAPGKGGVQLLGGAPPTTPPKPPDRPITGPFVLTTVSLFGPTEQPAAFNGEGVSPGVSVGARVGYRVNTPVSFDAMFEYSNILIEKGFDDSINYNLELARAGLNMRLQTPGRVARFYGNIGGGLTYEDLEFSFPAGRLDDCLTPFNATTRKRSCNDVSGVDGHFLIEAGLQLSFGGVLVDAAFGTYLQSTRGFGSGTYRDWLPIFQAGLRVGYGWWGL